MNYVRDCPTDAVSWNKAAERMDCQSIEHNCSGLNPQQHVFQYHCVVNGWMNATLEVCAFNRSILGMYNVPSYLKLFGMYIHYCFFLNECTL